LDLQHNNLSTLPEKIFDKLVNLEILDLQHNNLSTLPEKMLDKLVNLAILYLDKSNLALPEKIKNKKGLQIYY
ncbi:MAG: leucine-rich repeat domain-containing protein, partial [Flavobacteriales bacterium]